MGGTLFPGDHHDLDVDVLGQIGYLIGHTGRCRFGLEVFGIYLVDLLEIVDVLEQDSSLEDIFEGHAGRTEDFSDVVHHQAGFLLGRIQYDFARLGVDGDLSGDVEHRTVFYSLGVCTDGLGSFGGKDDLFHGINMVLIRNLVDWFS